MIRALVLVAALASTASADTPRWWQQFYVTGGGRTVLGLNDTASSTAFGLGYRAERAAWGIDVAAVDLQTGLSEGMHTIGRVTAYGELMETSAMSLWLGAGASYGIVRGWTNSDVPERTVRGLQWSVAFGGDLARHAGMAPFIELVIDAPLFPARDMYRSMDSGQRVIGVELALGVRL